MHVQSQAAKLRLGTFDSWMVVFAYFGFDQFQEIVAEGTTQFEQAKADDDQQTVTDLGYRRATTAELARCCVVQENTLYRLWPDKRAMFIAALDFVYQLSEETWTGLLEHASGDVSPAELILGLGTVVNIGRELKLLSAATRKRLLREIGGLLLGKL